MRLSEYFIAYKDEQSCRQFFKQKREKSGLVCTGCSSLYHYWIEKECRWQCILVVKSIVEVAYKVQNAVDDKHNLIVHTQDTNTNNGKAIHKAAV